jgi:phage tail sheath protein FI
MPVTVSYPGIYINEIQSSVHTITAAATSIAVFVGYTHPFLTVTPNQPVQLFSFSDYQRNFGGFFSNAAYDDDPKDFGSVALAVNQFFLNGGTECYVVGLQARAFTGSPLEPAPITPATVTVCGIVFQALQPTDSNNQMTIRVDNLKPGTGSPLQMSNADITITYGSGQGAQVEKYRQVSLFPGPLSSPNPNFITTRIGTPTSQVSSLVVIVPQTLPTVFAATQSGTMPASPPEGAVLFSESDFTAVFQANAPLDKVPIFNLLVLPGITDSGILSDAAAFCERKLAFLIIDPPYNSSADEFGGLTTAGIQTVAIGDSLNTTFVPPVEKNAALYFPYILSTDPVSGESIELPPSGTVAGIFASTDASRGVWKAPAGLATSILNSTGVVPWGLLTDPQQGVLNTLGVNCLRQFPGSGTVVFGARTLVTADPALSNMWRYVPVRRMALFLEQTLYSNLGWVVFEPNAEPLWTSIRTSIGAFMLGLFNQGAFQGDQPSDAFQVKCDDQTTVQADIDNGIVNIVVAFAPLKPAEFVVINIAQLAGQASS